MGCSGPGFEIRIRETDPKPPELSVCLSAGLPTANEQFCRFFSVRCYWDFSAPLIGALQHRGPLLLLAATAASSSFFILTGAARKKAKTRENKRTNIHFSCGSCTERKDGAPVTKKQINLPYTYPLKFFMLFCCNPYKYFSLLSYFPQLICHPLIFPSVGWFASMHTYL